MTNPMSQSTGDPGPRGPWSRDHRSCTMIFYTLIALGLILGVGLPVFLGGRSSPTTKMMWVADDGRIFEGRPTGRKAPAGSYRMIKGPRPPWSIRNVWAFTYPLGLVAGQAGAVVTYMIILAVRTGYAPTVRTLDSHVELAALGNSDQTKGSFFLGSGTLNEEQVIAYIAREGDGAMTIQHLDADRARIYESRNDDAYLDTISVSPADAWWLGPVFLGRAQYEFHVPQGTVNSEYRISVTG